MIEILLLPLPVTAMALNVGDEGVEGDMVVVVECRSEGEVGLELKTTVAKNPLIDLIVKFEGAIDSPTQGLNADPLPPSVVKLNDPPPPPLSPPDGLSFSQPSEPQQCLRLIEVEPPSPLRYIIGAAIMMIGVVLPVGYMMFRNKRVPTSSSYSKQT
ncbi:hypothetical protein ACFX1X_038207 [Malus domestica]|uniref:Malectin-like domain-containing protein n=1 Tax=Malus domestica TaxID=3750 RepID=A0A498JUN3_MALDO|nr:hypothetical protein DVH24_035910 [Malus domestica]